MLGDFSLDILSLILDRSDEISILMLGATSTYFQALVHKYIHNKIGSINDIDNLTKPIIDKILSSGYYHVLTKYMPVINKVTQSGAYPYFRTIKYTCIGRNQKCIDYIRDWVPTSSHYSIADYTNRFNAIDQIKLQPALILRDITEEERSEKKLERYLNVTRLVHDKTFGAIDYAIIAPLFSTLNIIINPDQSTDIKHLACIYGNLSVADPTIPQYRISKSIADIAASYNLTLKSGQHKMLYYTCEYHPQPSRITTLILCTLNQPTLLSSLADTTFGSNRRAPHQNNTINMEATGAIIQYMFKHNYIECIKILLNYNLITLEDIREDALDHYNDIITTEYSLMPIDFYTICYGGDQLLMQKWLDLYDADEDMFPDAIDAGLYGILKTILNKLYIEHIPRKIIKRQFIKACKHGHIGIARGLMGDHPLLLTPADVDWLNTILGKIYNSAIVNFIINQTPAENIGIIIDYAMINENPTMLGCLLKNRCITDDQLIEIILIICNDHNDAMIEVIFPHLTVDIFDDNMEAIVKTGHYRVLELAVNAYWCNWNEFIPTACIIGWQYVIKKGFEDYPDYELTPTDCYNLLKHSDKDKNQFVEWTTTTSSSW